MREREREGERSTERCKENETRKAEHTEEQKARGVQTTSQIGFIVRLMKAITRGLVVPHARGITRRKGLVASRVAHPRVHTGRDRGRQSRGRITLRIDHPRLPINGTARYAVRPYVARVMTRSRCAATQTRVSSRRGRIKDVSSRTMYGGRFPWIFMD